MAPEIENEQFRDFAYKLIFYAVFKVMVDLVHVHFIDKIEKQIVLRLYFIFQRHFRAANSPTVLLIPFKGKVIFLAFY